MYTSTRERKQEKVRTSAQKLNLCTQKHLLKWQYNAFPLFQQWLKQILCIQYPYVCFENVLPPQNTLTVTHTCTRHRLLYTVARDGKWITCVCKCVTILCRFEWEALCIVGMEATNAAAVRWGRNMATCQWWSETTIAYRSVLLAKQSAVGNYEWGACFSEATSAKWWGH